MNSIHHASALSVLTNTAEASIDMIYTDPPFGTGKERVLSRKRLGKVISKITYNDRYDDYLAFLKEHVVEMHRVLKPTGTLYLHLDCRWVHYAKVMLDEVFGDGCFLNEVIWAYDFGGRGKTCWPKKHDNILVYVKTPGEHVFNWDDIDRIPYAAPEMQLVGRTPGEAASRIAAGKVPTDVWTMSIVGTNARERNGYATQKPVKLIERAILASSPLNGVILDCFAGSGTTGEAAHKHGRQFILIDQSLLAIEVMQKRFKDIDVEWVL